MKSRTVGEVMTRDVVHASRGTTFADLMLLLDRRRVSGVPVVDDDDKVIGVVSEADLIRRQAAGVRARLRSRLPRSSAQAARRDHGRPCTVTLERLMSSPALTVHPEQQVAAAARVMERHRVNRLPVVDEEDRLIGIITRHDLLRVFLRTDEEIRAEVADEVLGRALGLPSGTVTVCVTDGMVTLAGHVGHAETVASAVRRAWRVDGVIGVVNRLTTDGCQ
ncbi:CBS domain-containing protein [Streptomyces gamaensis]|uniref:CBS domain-containing protein n=1 Tax=Streptomyces gamaensis TaxID=1763542 RepID=A0ABW0Z1H3_9ACTN